MTDFLPAECIIADAIVQRLRGQGPRLPFINAADPTEAISLALGIVAGDVQARLIDERTSAAAAGRKYEYLNDKEIRAVARQIIRTSSSIEEVKSRLADELGYPYEVNLSMDVPTDQASLEARELGRGLGGVISQNGAMVLCIIDGHEDPIIL